MSDFEIIIVPEKSIKNFRRELWQYRELFYFLAWKDFIVRYKQTTIGIAWSVLRPLFAMIIFTIIFGQLAKLPSDGIPYPLLVFSAMLPWQFFSNTFMEASNSLIVNTSLVSKIYFPRIIIPTTSMIVNLVDFLISFCMLVIMMIFYTILPTWKILLLPFLLILSSVLSLGAGYFIAALNVKYRDFRYVVPFLIQLGLYISPVGFSSNIVPLRWKLLYSLNPMVGVIDGFRWALAGNQIFIFWPGFVLSVFLSILIFVLGARYFFSVERSFADNI
jgi:lipopolysaccharide transport system permease protein